MRASPSHLGRDEKTAHEETKDADGAGCRKYCREVEVDSADGLSRIEKGDSESRSAVVQRDQSERHRNAQKTNA